MTYCSTAFAVINAGLKPILADIKNGTPTISCEEIKKKITKDDVQKAYIKIQKKIHPDISPETTRLSMIVNEAKEVVLKNIA